MLPQLHDSIIDGSILKSFDLKLAVLRAVKVEAHSHLAKSADNGVLVLVVESTPRFIYPMSE